MNRVFADAWFYIAFLNVADAGHAHAAEAALEYADIIVTSEFVLIEVADCFAGTAIGRKRAHELLRRIRRMQPHAIIPASPDVFDRGLELYSARADKRWSLTDCTSFVIMKQRAITQALTHDVHFEQAGFEALLRPRI